MKKLTLKRQLTILVNKYKLAAVALDRAKLNNAPKEQLIKLNNKVRLAHSNLMHFIDSLEI